MSCRWLRLGAALAVGSWIGLGAALAESRMALVIGNSAYQTVPALPNPVNDARAVSEFLQSAGFEVITVQNLTQADMRQSIGRFADALSGKGQDTVALVYYAGHGLQVDGENYLVPVDAGILREADVPMQAIRLADLMKALAAVPSKSRIVMLDACRNNPFSEINKVTGRGLAIVDAPPDTIVSYSTSPGSEALDGDDAHSPYTKAFLAMTKEPGLPIEQAFKRMRFAVNDATNRQQLPWESSSLKSDFSFFPGGTGYALQSAPTDTNPQATKVSVNPGGAALASSARTSVRSVDAWKRELMRKTPSEAYEVVIREDAVEAYQAFIALFPGQANSPSVRTVLDRRNVMIAWYVAVTVDTPASYQAFLTAYPDNDLTATARRLMELARNRAITQPQTANLCPCNLPVQPQQQPTPPQPEQRAQPTRSIDKKQTAKEKKKEAKREKEKPVKRARRAPEPEEAAPQPVAAPVQQAAPVMPMIPIGIGMGGGLMGGGFMGGGRPMGGPTGGGYNRGGGSPMGGATKGGGTPMGGGSPSPMGGGHTAPTPASTGSGGYNTTYPNPR